MKSRRVSRSHRPTIESLETRQLLSLTVDLRLPGGGKSVTVTGTGQKINLEIWATVRGGNSSTSDERLQIAVGSLLSSNINGGAANGTLKATNLSPFNSFGSQTGAQKDLDGDGDLDVGTNTSTDGSSFWAGRAGGPMSGTSFKIGNATFTVTSLKSTSGQTNLTFRPRTSGGTGALWWEDGNQKQVGSGSYVAGSPVVLKRSGGTTGGSAKITGTVFSDNDKDGVLDSTDTRLSSRRIFIDSNNDGRYNSGEKNVFSNSSGVYTFSNLSAGTYRVRRDMPTGYTNSTPSSQYHLVTVSGTQTVSGKNFGAIPSGGGGTGSAKITGVVFSDNDKDGVLDSTDTRLSSRRIFIDSNNDGRYNSGEKNVFSNSSGVYTFSNLSAGTYRVRRDMPTGYTNSTPSSQYHLVTVSGTQTVSGKNFGAIPSSGSSSTNTSGTGKISGTLFDDRDKDGIVDNGESRLSSRRMYIDANKDGKYNSGEKSVLSNSSGVYTFTGLSSGTYRIRRADLPGGYGYTVPSSGYYDILLGNGASVTGKNFGFRSL